MRNGGRDQQAQGSGPEHGDHVAFGDRRPEHGVHRTGHRLDGHRVLVAQRSRHPVELALVRDEPAGRPAATGVGAEARLETGADVPEGQVAAIPHLPRLARRTRRLDAPGRASEDRLQHHTAPGRQRLPLGTDHLFGHDTDHLVARHEREGDDVLEVARAAPVQRGKVGPADAGQDRVDVHPAVGRRLGRLLLHQAERADAGPAAGSERRHHTCRGKARQRALEQQRAHGRNAFIAP